MTFQLSNTTMAHSNTTIAPSDLIEGPVQSIFASDLSIVSASLTPVNTSCKVSTLRGPNKGCGITVPIDGSNDATINIRGLNDYDVPKWRSNKTLNTELGGDFEGQLGSESECYTEGVLSNTGSGLKVKLTQRQWLVQR